MLTFSLASLMQFWNSSRICSLPRQGSVSASSGGKLSAMDFLRIAAARAARACARSRWSSLEPRKKGLVGDWRRAAIGSLCFWAVGLGLRVSAIVIERLNWGKYENGRVEMGTDGYEEVFPPLCV